MLSSAGGVADGLAAGSVASGDGEPDADVDGAGVVGVADEDVVDDGFGSVVVSRGITAKAMAVPITATATAATAIHRIVRRREEA